MDETRKRLETCFQLIFPDLPTEAVTKASQQSVAAWDSVAAITLMNVIEEEFGLEMDLDELADLDSFEKVFSYLQNRLQAA